MLSVHEGNVSPHRMQSYIFCTYIVHIMCIFYRFLTKFIPRRGRWCWLHRWRLVGSSRSEQRATKERGRSEERAHLSVSRQPLPTQPSAVAVSRCAISRCPLPSAVSRCRCPQPSAVAFAQSVRRQVAGAAADGGAFAAGRQAAGAAACGGLGFGRQARRLGATLWRLGTLCG